MKLRRQQAAAGDRGTKLATVVGRATDIAGLRWPGVVGVHKIEVGGAASIFAERPVVSPSNPVPAHMRHLQRRVDLKPHHIARERRQPLMLPSLQPRFEKQLQPHADAQKGLVGRKMPLNRLDEAAAAELSHGVAKGPDTRQDQNGGLSHTVCVGGDRRLSAKPLAGLLHAAEVAAAVVDDRDAIHKRSLRSQQPLANGPRCVSGGRALDRSPAQCGDSARVRRPWHCSPRDDSIRAPRETAGCR